MNQNSGKPLQSKARRSIIQNETLANLVQNSTLPHIMWNLALPNQVQNLALPNPVITPLLPKQGKKTAIPYLFSIYLQLCLSFFVLFVLALSCNDFAISHHCCHDGLIFNTFYRHFKHRKLYKAKLSP